jgi:anti-sigma factor RsiW
MGNPRCKWVRERLPLLAGEELRGLDLRRVERHLIGCPKCRCHRVSLDQTLNVLHAASAHSSAPHDAPSLWPELSRQIRQSRRPAQAPLFTWPRLGFGPAFALGLGLALVVTAIVVGARQPAAGPKTLITANRATPAVASVSAPPALASEAPDPARGETASKPPAETLSVESVPASRMAYDLDHAMPIGSTEVREKSQKTH